MNSRKIVILLILGLLSPKDLGFGIDSVQSISIKTKVKES